jgi:hypothetical protein
MMATVTAEIDTPGRAPEAARTLFGDVKVAAAIFGVSWRTYIRWAARGLVPAGYKLGGKRLWLLAELDAFIANGCRPVRRGGRSS